MDKIASERGRKSAEEFQKILILTSMGALGLFFSILTKSIDPILTSSQIYISITSILMLGVSSGVGIYNWYLDAKINLIWSYALKEEDKRNKKELYKSRNLLKKLEGKLNIIFFSSYAIGMALSIVFLTFRILNV